MKIVEFQPINIYLSNEEQAVLEKVVDITPIEAYNEREQVVIENLIRKSVLIKVPQGHTYLLLKNE